MDETRIDDLIDDTYQEDGETDDIALFATGIVSSVCFIEGFQLTSLVVIMVFLSTQNMVIRRNILVKQV
jgi:hypothetical protein